MTHTRAVGTGALTLSLALTACGGSGSSSWSGEVTDSAGITIVSSPDRGVWGEGEAWTLEEAFRVGGMDAATEAQFGQVVGLDRDADGNVYVLDQQAREIRAFDPSGQFLRTISGPGGGPGELGMGVMGLFVVDQELWVPDPGNVRVTRVGLDGSVAGNFPLDFAARGIPIRWDELAGDKVVAQFRSMGAFTGQSEGGPAEDVIMSIGSETPDTLATLPQGGTFQMAGDRPQFRFFSSEAVWDAGADGSLVSAMNDEYSIEVRDASGTLQRVIRKAHVPREVTESDQQRMLDAIREMMQTQAAAPPAAIDAILEGASFAEHYPAMAQVLSGPQGSLWVQQVRTATEVAETGEIDLQDMGSRDWEIFDGEGRFMGTLAFPGRFQPIRVIGDTFWGVERDEFDVQSVVAYRVLM